MRALPKEKRLNAIAMLQHGLSTCEVSKLLGISQSTCSRIRRECVPHVAPARGGHPKNISPTQRRASVRATTIGGLDNVYDMRNALREHLNMVVNTKTVRRALHEACIGLLKKQIKFLLTTKNVRCRLEFVQCHQDWTIHDWFRVIFSDETKIDRF